MEYHICKRCIMDTSDYTIKFDEMGYCNYCRDAIDLIKKEGYRGEESDRCYKEIINRIKLEQKPKKYDCIIGVSGGVDSAYLMHLAHKEGLRILAVHVDAGFNSNTAVGNIRKLCSKMGIELETVVIDWSVFKELQRAYMFSGLPNLDAPQDHVFFSALYRFAEKNSIKYVLTGSNVATESILPAYLAYDATDYICLKDVFEKHKRGNVSLKKYPHMSYMKQRHYLSSLSIIRLLNYVDYSKTKAIQTLHDEYDWEYYGGKHWESRFTKFVQACYLPEKFGFNKSRAHLSNLVVNDEISREEALGLLEKEEIDYPEEERLEDKDYILKKLDITESEWEGILSSPIKCEDDYRNIKNLKKTFNLIKSFGKRIRLL